MVEYSKATAVSDSSAEAFDSGSARDTGEQNAANNVDQCDSQSIQRDSNTGNHESQVSDDFQSNDFAGIDNCFGGNASAAATSLESVETALGMGEGSQCVADTSGDSFVNSSDSVTAELNGVAGQQLAEGESTVEDNQQHDSTTGISEASRQTQQSSPEDVFEMPETPAFENQGNEEGQTNQADSNQPSKSAGQIGDELSERIKDAAPNQHGQTASCEFMEDGEISCEIRGEPLSEQQHDAIKDYLENDLKSEFEAGNISELSIHESMPNSEASIDQAHTDEEFTQESSDSPDSQLTNDKPDYCNTEIGRIEPDCGIRIDAPNEVGEDLPQGFDIEFQPDERQESEADENETENSDRECLEDPEKATGEECYQSIPNDFENQLEQHNRQTNYSEIEREPSSETPADSWDIGEYFENITTVIGIGSMAVPIYGDAISLLASAANFVVNPSWSSVGDVLLDTLGVLPLVPALGTMNRAERLADAAHDASKAIDAAHDASKGIDAAHDAGKGIDAAHDAGKGIDAAHDAGKAGDTAADTSKASGDAPDSPDTTKVGDSPDTGKAGDSAGEADEISRDVDRAFDKGHVTTDAEITELTRYGDASHVRGQLGLSGRQNQAAHGAPQSAMRGVTDYNPRNAFTRITPNADHRSLDAGWKRDAQARANRGETTWTAQECFASVAESIQNAEGLTTGQQQSFIAHVFCEMFIENGLQSTDLIRLPYSR